MYDTNVECDGESALVVHIRHKLLNYVTQHITADYIQLTEQAVIDLCDHCLVEIPITDPITLTPNPFDSPTGIHGLGPLDPFQEEFQTTPDAIQHIRNFMKSQAGKPMSDRVAFNETSSESYIPVCRPFSPILTSRARRETPRPKPFAPKVLDTLPPSHRDFLTSQGIAPIGVEPILEISFTQDEFLDTKWCLRQEECDAVRLLLNSALTGPTKEYQNRHLNFSSRPDSPPIPSRASEPEFIARKRYAGNGVRESDRLSTIPPIVLPWVNMEDIESNLHQQNMIVVDEASRSSPSPTPSPLSTQEDSLDDHFMESPDTTPPPGPPTKIGIVQIPVVEVIYGKNNPPHIGQGIGLEAVSLAPDIASRALGIADFAKLRAKKIIISVPESLSTSTPNLDRLEEPSRSIPENVYDRNTLHLPFPWNPPNLPHRYMVSMDLVQKQGLVRFLRSRSCSIDLVERDTLAGVDIIIDPKTAIIFTNLLVLPSEFAEVVSKIAQQSWLYSRLLVIFDAYPPAYSFRSKDTCNVPSELFAYSPPVLKALGRLRRDLGISEGCGTKREECLVQYAFADTVEEAAMFARYFGDLAEASDDSQGELWGDRAWLDGDVLEVLRPSALLSFLLLLIFGLEGEQDLAAADGMNRFAAYLILSQIDLAEFLELSAEARVEMFGAFVGIERMMLLNRVIEHRLQTFQSSDWEMESSVVASQGEEWI
ncbi:hypothetical protein MVEN_00322900 [Mycena venus]|uniref:Uncharacterized protein n=1 Tax=Mycena venus TaxID=2733690 RepID=A0A8H7D6X9_9AGAR|nr:hypothetical protein MVEN_00322900 [Mycena venus]